MKFILLALLFTGLFCHKTFAQASQHTDTIINGKKCVYASFRGGVDGWRRYLEGNLQYPKKAIKKNIQGLVLVEMTVDTKGFVTEVKAQNDPGSGLAAEAERVIKEGPKWIPATEDGKPVTFKFIQSITFQLQ